ncbi:MAG: alpha/beta fold hydrolase [Planctomycetota bacterium]
MKRTWIAALVLAAACSSPYGRLRSEDEIISKAALVGSATHLPNKKGTLAVTGPLGHPAKIAYRHTTRGREDRLVVLLHGVLSDRLAWRYTAGDLGRDHRLLLIDLPGCGKSDKPHPDKVGPTGYSPDALARQVWQVVRKRGESCRRIALVGHSLGSMIILRMLGDSQLRREYADVIERVDRVVLVSPVDFRVATTHPTFKKIVDLNGIEVAIADLVGILLEETGRSVSDGACRPENMPREEADRLYEILRNPETRKAAQAMLRQAIPFKKDGRPDHDPIDALEADYANLVEPCLILTGHRDETFPVAMSYKLRAELPNAKLKIVRYAKHSLPVEVPRLCAREIRNFLITGGRGYAEIEKIDNGMTRHGVSRHGEARHRVSQSVQP